VEWSAARGKCPRELKEGYRAPWRPESSLEQALGMRDPTNTADQTVLDKQQRAASIRKVISSDFPTWNWWKRRTSGLSCSANSIVSLSEKEVDFIKHLPEYLFIYFSWSLAGGVERKGKHAAWPRVGGLPKKFGRAACLAW
jgi:hypothetical protein